MAASACHMLARVELQAMHKGSNHTHESLDMSKAGARAGAGAARRDTAELLLSTFE